MIFHSDAIRGQAYRLIYQGLARPDFTATSGIRGALPGRPIMHDDSADIGSVERRGAAAVPASVRTGRRYRSSQAGDVSARPRCRTKNSLSTPTQRMLR
jgi:hypothetical protein